jgi:hypothetical protein
MVQPAFVLCAAFSTIGGFIFGYDPGVVSIVLVMPQILEQFPCINGGGGFRKGLLTAMIELGCTLGCVEPRLDRGQDLTQVLHDGGSDDLHP